MLLPHRRQAGAWIFPRVNKEKSFKAILWGRRRNLSLNLLNYYWSFFFPLSTSLRKISLSFLGMFMKLNFYNPSDFGPTILENTGPPTAWAESNCDGVKWWKQRALLSGHVDDPLWTYLHIRRGMQGCNMSLEDWIQQRHHPADKDVFTLHLYGTN